MSLLPYRDHIYVDWPGNGRCTFCDGEYADHARPSARQLVSPYPMWWGSRPKRRWWQRGPYV